MMSPDKLQKRKSIFLFIWRRLRKINIRFLPPYKNSKKDVNWVKNNFVKKISQREKKMRKKIFGWKVFTRKKFTRILKKYFWNKICLFFFLIDFSGKGSEIGILRSLITVSPTKEFFDIDRISKNKINENFYL